MAPPMEKGVIMPIMCPHFNLIGILGMVEWGQSMNAGIF
jgi:hypothetical protein